MAELTREGVASVDPAGMLGDVLDQPAQLRDALWRVESAGLTREQSPGGFVVCGMGGSAIGGDLAEAVLGPRAERPVVVARGYEPPPWIGPGTLVLCSSYSGDTEETLAAYSLAGEAGARRVVLTTGAELASRARAEGVPVIGVPSGMQPRAAVAYVTVAALECAALCGAGPPLRQEIEDAADGLARRVEEWGPDAADSTAKRIAEAVHGAVPVVYGAEATAAPARRWKTQLNENAESIALWSELPEADHNEIVGFDSAPEGVIAVFLEDRDQNECNRRRIELTAELARRGGMAVERVESVGDTRAERVLSLVLLGDLVSVYVAALAGVDPTPVAAIERFKQDLA